MPVSSRRAVNSTFIILCQSSQVLVFGGIALFLPLIRKEIGLSFAQAGTLVAATQLTYALMQIPAGYLANRFNPKRLFVIGVVMVNVLSLQFFWIDSYALVLTNQAISGIFRSLVFAPGLLLILGQFEPQRRQTAMGLYVAGGFSSNVVLSLVGPWLVRSLSWRVLFVVFSLIGLAVVLIYWKVGDQVSRADHEEPMRIGALTAILRHPVIWTCGAIQFVRLAVAIGLIFWLPTYLVVEKGFSLAAAGLMVAVSAGVTAPANFFGGLVSDLVDRPKAVVGVSLAALSLGLVALVQADSIAAVALAVAWNSLFVQIYFGPLFEIPIRLLGREKAGVTTGFSNFCANLGGLTFGFTLGAVKDATGSFDVGLYCMAAACVVGLLATSRLPDLRLRKTAPEHMRLT